jgi:hypothetical protein
MLSFYSKFAIPEQGVKPVCGYVPFFCEILEILEVCPYFSTLFPFISVLKRVVGFEMFCPKDCNQYA